MVTMASGSALRTEGDHDGRLRLPDEAYDGRGQLGWIGLLERAVAIPAELHRFDAENARRRQCFFTAQTGELLSRRNGDAGIFSGVPIGRAKKISPNSCIGELGEHPADAIRLVVRMRENACDPVCCQLPPPTTAEQAENEDEHVEQVEIDRDRRHHVIILPVSARPQ